MNSTPLNWRETMAWSLLGVVLFLGLWSGLTTSGLVPRQFLPPPQEVASRFIQLLTSPFAGATLPQHLGSSFMRYAYGVLLAAAIGVPLGLLMGWFRLLDDIVTPIFDGLRFIAPIAWVPFAALWFGTGIGGPVMIIFAGAFPPCLINAYRGARFVEPRLIEAARMRGTGHTRMILEILLPAAVPSIVFGLLGLAVFLAAFGMPRSAPLVGGLVLALLTLPTIIIASRAALRAVPPSIREAARGVGASQQQAVFHHVLPLAMPGIMTGTILAVASAIGETAPLLLIGMVAFIVDVPTGFFDTATVLPVQIYLWSDLPERAFVARTAAAIVVLLVIMMMLNALAIFLRKKFERRW